MTDALKSLAKLRGSDEIISYLTGDKLPVELFPTKVGMDIIEIFANHLSKIGKKNKISLFLYTSGGVLEAPWPLISLLREYCKELEVIVPSKALSAGTLICLGADKIVMSPASFLSPIDPEGTYSVNGGVKQLQVEDVAGFLDFVKEKVGIVEQSSLIEAVKQLTNEIPASVLGSVNRTHSLIRMLAQKMLKTHKIHVDEEVSKEIIENLTAKLYSHKHLIGRKEAKYSLGFGNLIDYAKATEERLIKEIFSGYRTEMLLDKVFDPESVLEGNDSNTLNVKRAIIRSSQREDGFMTTYTISRNQVGQPQPYNINLSNVGWKEIVHTEQLTETE